MNTIENNENIQGEWENELDDLLEDFGLGYYWESEGWTDEHKNMRPVAEKALKSFVSHHLSLARKDLIKEMERKVMIATTEAEEQHCKGHLPCKACVVAVRQKFLEALTDTK